MSKPRCRHEQHSWFVGGGNGEWCYVCGAYRGLRFVGPGVYEPRTKWVRPTGDPNKNPYDKLTEPR